MKYYKLQAIAWQHKLISTIRYELNSLASYYVKCFLHSHKPLIRTFLFLICKCLSITNIFSNARKTTSVSRFEKKRLIAGSRKHFSQRLSFKRVANGFLQQPFLFSLEFHYVMNGEKRAYNLFWSKTITLIQRGRCFNSFLDI